MDDAGDFDKLRASNAERGAMPPGFFLTAEGLHYLPPGKDDDPPLFICRPLKVLAATHDATGNAWGCLLEWHDANGQRHEWAMPQAMLAGDGTEVRARLMDGGLSISPSRKGRAGRDGGARKPAEWRLLFLSTGEVGIAARMAEAGGGPKRARAGQEVRVLDIPADTGVHGAFETLHDCAKPARFA